MKKLSWDLIPGIDAVARSANTFWFEWEDGLRLFHWWCPDFYYQKMSWDGIKVHSEEWGRKWCGQAQQARLESGAILLMNLFCHGWPFLQCSRVWTASGWCRMLSSVVSMIVFGFQGSLFQQFGPIYEQLKKGHNIYGQLGHWRNAPKLCRVHSNLRALCGVDLSKYGGAIHELETMAWEVWQRASQWVWNHCRTKLYKEWWWQKGLLVRETHNTLQTHSSGMRYGWMNSPGSDAPDPSSHHHTTRVSSTGNFHPT